MGWLKKKAEQAANTAGGAVVGSTIGGAAMGPAGQVAGGYLGGQKGAGGIGENIDRNNPYVQGPRQANQAKAEADAKARELYQQTIPLNDLLNQADTGYGKEFEKSKNSYLSSAKGLVNEYTGKINQLSNQAKSQATDATKTYTNDILPGFKDAMGMARSNANQAMSLSEAGDPNNSIQKAVRKLYDQQGQQVRQQGQQDFGVLSALGAQAAQGQIGAAGGPLTAGVQGQIYGANQQQAGDAYARAQQRVFDLQQQGLDRGFDQSNQQYQFGQDAQDRYAQRTKDLQSAGDAYYGQQGKFRDEQSGYAGDNLGVRAGLNTDILNLDTTGSGIRRDNAYAGTGRQQQALNALYGTQQQAITNQQQANTANNAAKGQFVSSLIGSGAKLLGSAAA